MARGVRRHPPGQRQLLVQRGALMIELGLVVARLLHYTAVTTLAGVAFFPLYAYASAEPKELCDRRQAILLSSAVGALLGGVIWLVFTGANMCGAWSGGAEREIICAGLEVTTFGS